MNYHEWEKTVPVEIKNDSLWKIEAYRLALFVNDIGWRDVTKLMKDKRTIGLSDQLYRALGSTSGNMEEGYSRRSNKDRARFYEYSLGSARESRGWYYRGRHILGDVVTQHRIQLLTQIIRLLLTMIPEQRGYAIGEDKVSYYLKTDIDHEEAPLSQEELEHLLTNVPLPT